MQPVSHAGLSACSAMSSLAPAVWLVAGVALRGCGLLRSPWGPGGGPGSPAKGSTTVAGRTLNGGALAGMLRYVRMWYTRA
jgi:hypothetical protein